MLNQFDSSGTNTTTGWSYLEDGTLDNTEGFGAFADLPLTPNTHNFDLGGGKFDNSSIWLKETYNITNHVYDPFQRTAQHNESILECSPFDSGTLMGVLNVIELKQHRIEALELLKRVVKGPIYIKIWEGDKTGASFKEEKRFQNNQPTSWYFAEVLSVFPNATCHSEKHLIVVDNGQNTVENNPEHQKKS